MSHKSAAAPRLAPDAEKAEQLRNITSLLGHGGLLLLLLAVVVAANGSADTWWHLATGRWIVQHHAVPHVDPFSYTFGGKPWIAHEYLSEVILYLTYVAAGLPGLVMVSAGLLTLGFWLVYRRCTGPVVVNGAAVLLGAVSALPGISLRPQMFTFALGAVYLWILDRYQRERKPAALLWLPVLMLLWVQLHGGYILGLAIVGVIFAGAVLDALAPGKPANVLKKNEILALLWTLLACGAVVLLNPFGVAAYTQPFVIMGMRINQQILEWQTPSITMVRFQPFYLLLGLTLVTMIVARKRYRPGQWLLFLAFALAAVRSGRNMAVFPLVAVPLLAQGVRLPQFVAEWGRKFTPPMRVGLALGLLLAGAVAASQRTSMEVRFQQETALFGFPFKAVKFLAANPMPGNLLNGYTYGGYLIWMLPPQYKVFVDGRADLYGDDFLENYAAVYNGNVPPDPLLDAYNIRTVLAEPQSALAAELKDEAHAGKWHEVYRDPIAVIFTR